MDNQTNTPNNTSPTPVKKPIQLYLTAALIVLTIISIILSSVCIGVVINKNKPKIDKTVEVIYEFVIVEGITRGQVWSYGSIINKPEKPTLINNVFSAGLVINETKDNAINEHVFTNPTLSNGFIVNNIYIFDGWYTEHYYENNTHTYSGKWDFSEDRVYRTTRLYAKWIEKV